MKFAKELDEDRVPEWQSQYLNYKQGKRKIKAVARALRSATARQWRTPRQLPQRTPSHRGLTSSTSSNDGRASPTAINIAKASRAVDRVRLNERDGGVLRRFGSIVGSPPSDEEPPTPSRPASLNLGDPAMDVSEETTSDLPRSYSTPSLKSDEAIPADMNRSHATDTPGPTPKRAYEIGQTKHPSPLRSSLRRAFTSPLQGSSAVRSMTDKPLFRRVMSRASISHHSKSPVDIPLEAQREVDASKDEFWQFLESELRKIELFYKTKEDEANARMRQLVTQLHLLRDHRIRELDNAKQVEHLKERKSSKATSHKEPIGEDSLSPDSQDSERHRFKTLYSSINTRRVHFHRSKSDGESSGQSLMTPPAASLQDARLDHVRSVLPTHHSYHAAKRKLRAALQEYYRGLELLKSYVLLNRTAFRKINKKYDKVVRMRPYLAFMSQVNDAHFVQSDILDSHLHQVEDLYTRYFEKGNRKVAISKLRRRGLQTETFHSTAFRNGLFAAAGTVFGIQGLVYGVELLYDNPPNSLLQLHTSYLLQLYGGYFLILLLMLYFCIVGAVFDAARVNYAFIFEFDTRHSLNWKQLAEIPCFLYFLLGVIIWLNFSRFGGDNLYIYWPVILIGLSLVILALPGKILYYRSRLWLWKTFMRVAFLSGLVSVHFRDLILGDMLNSLTYSVGNVELFFCLYSGRWNDADQCNSSHSRLFGFFQTLPAIWRLLQCFRRYRDSRKAWPHLANAGKYTCSLLSYMILSIWRIDKSVSALAAFGVFAGLNSVYCIVWDVVMDWSLFTGSSEHRFLRDTIAYRPVAYYISIILDFVLRFNWVFYVIFRHDAQHSAVNSFSIALSEVTRRAIWTAFRVENDHCFNIVSNKAVRDLGLPYKVEEMLDHVRTEGSITETDETESDDSRRGTQDLESGTSGIASSTSYSPTKNGESNAVRSLRRRQTGNTLDIQKSSTGRSRVGDLISSAHAQDFERTKPNEAVPDEDEDEEEEEDELDDDERELEAYHGRGN